MKPHLIELNITELCNRTCSFCPRGHGYENKNLNMSLDTVDLIINQCKEFTKNIHICGRGEPLLNKNILQIVKKLVKYFNVKIVSNGDKLFEYLKDLDDIMDLTNPQSNNTITISLYDNNNQYSLYKEKTKKYNNIGFFKVYDTGNNLNDKKFIDSHQISNRSGFLKLKNSNENKPCYLPLNRGFIDWNGDVNLCCHDWKEKLVFGNIHTKSFTDIWLNNLKNIKQMLVKGNRFCTKACKNCNVNSYDMLQNLYPDWIEKQNKRIKKIWL
tara:strand:- start:845 stop:1654 length:810 start_codon:yes stop_codon:yes gene_type:complete